MMVRASWSLVALLALGFSGCGDEETGVQTGAALREALDGAEPGATVEIASGRFEGPFTVPSGVDIHGAGRGETILYAGEGEDVLTVDVGEGATQISSLTIEVGPTPVDGYEPAETEIGLLARDAGRVTLTRVDVEVKYGIGVGVEALESLTLNDVTIAGRVTEGNQNDWPTPPAVETSPAYGLVAFTTASVAIDGLDVSGLAASGVQLVDSNTSWIDGSVHTNMGVSVFVSGGTADLDGVAVSAPLAGFQLIPPYGLAIGNGAVVDTNEVTIQGDAEVAGGSSVGLLQDSSVSMHTNLSVTDNGGFGVWVQHSAGTAAEPALVLAAGRNDLSRNSGIGLALIESTGVRVEDTVIEDTASMRRIIGDLSDVEIGDGIEIRRCADTDCAGNLTDVEIASVALHRNSRAAMIIEALDAPASGVNCGSIEVDASGIGAVVQDNTDAPGGWDAIVNTGSGDFLETVRGIDPGLMPPGNLDGMAGR
jgi:hypothetical protein